MSVSKIEATEALQDIDQFSNRSATLYEYQQGSPYFILWGIAWMIGYSLSDFFPKNTGLIWMIVDMLGAFGSIMIARTNTKSRERHKGWRHIAVAFTLLGFIMATFAILPPHSNKQVSAYFPLIIATMYVLLGIWNGMRLVITGITVAILTLVGFFLIDTHFNLWMAGVGGGALILAGVWLRRV